MRPAETGEMDMDDFDDDLADEDLILALEAASSMTPTTTAMARAKMAPTKTALALETTQPTALLASEQTRSNAFVLPKPIISRLSADRRSSTGPSPSPIEKNGIARQPPQRTIPQVLSRQARATDVAAELEGLPSDAFDSSLSSFTNGAADYSQQEVASTNNSRQTTRLSGQTSFRQTTLFGNTIHEEAQLTTHTQGGNHVYRSDLPTEKPTHHKLDQEALKTWVYPTNLGPVRDYQFSIVKNGLFNNTLVALPTGLGKTFIAATVMLNFYRWTRDAKLIFAAPTKALVSQQVEACLNIAGIPRSETTLLTGHTAPALREAEWKSKRLFFMTPQTLQNDLSHGYADPKSIVLLVVDEAHRATGDYAYVKVIGFIRRFTKSFRVLALTATPGSKVESVQEVIDNLGVSHVEIRTEESIDIRQYVHARDVERFTVDPSPEMRYVQDHLTRAIRPLCEKLDQQHIFYGREPMNLTVYTLQRARHEWMSGPGRHANPGTKGMVNSVISVLQSVAHPIKLLHYHGIKPFFDSIAEFRREAEKSGGSKNKTQLVQNPDFQEMMLTVERWITEDSFESHPKIGFLKNRLIEHFESKPPGSNTRAIVFSEFRDSAEDIVRTLNRCSSSIKASIFVGQADSKRSAGMKQKDQLAAIEDFKNGAFNVLVATSIGEEGLDIGQVDLIICYDASSSPIRMLQRMGRTGRKRAGHVVLLLMKGKEEEKFLSAQDNHEQMQKLICDGSRFTFRFDLSERIVPRSAKPEVDKRFIEIPLENTQTMTPPEPKKGGARLKKSKKKYHMLDGVETGFVVASSVLGGRNRTAQAIEMDLLADIPDLVTAVQSVKNRATAAGMLTNQAFNASMADLETCNIDTTDSLVRLLPYGYLKHGEFTRRNVKLIGRLDGGDYVRPPNRGDAYMRMRIPKLVASSDMSGDEGISAGEGTGQEEVRVRRAVEPLAKRRRISGPDVQHRSSPGPALKAPSTVPSKRFQPPKRTERERLTTRGFDDHDAVVVKDEDEDEGGDGTGRWASKRKSYKQTVKGMTRQRSSQWQAYSSYTFSGGRNEPSTKHEESSSDAEPPLRPPTRLEPRREPIRPTALKKAPVSRLAAAVLASPSPTSREKLDTELTAQRITYAISDDDEVKDVNEPTEEEVDDEEVAEREKDKNGAVADVVEQEGGLINLHQRSPQPNDSFGYMDLSFPDDLDEELFTKSPPPEPRLPDNRRQPPPKTTHDVFKAMAQEAFPDICDDDDNDSVEVIRFSQPARHARGSLRKPGSRSNASNGQGRGRGRGRGGKSGKSGKGGKGGQTESCDMDALEEEEDDKTADDDDLGVAGCGRGGRGRGRERRGRGGGRVSYGRLEDRGDDCTRTSDNYDTDGSDSGGDLLDFIVGDDEDEDVSSLSGSSSFEDDDGSRQKKRATSTKKAKGKMNPKKETNKRRRKNAKTVFTSSAMTSSLLASAKSGDDTPMELDGGSDTDVLDVFHDKHGRGNEQKQAGKQREAAATISTAAKVFKARVRQRARAFATLSDDDIEDVDEDESEGNGKDEDGVGPRGVFARAAPQGRRTVLASESE